MFGYIDDNTEKLLLDIKNNKAIALFLGSGIDINMKYPGHNYKVYRSRKKPVRQTLSELHHLYNKYYNQINNNKDFVINWDNLLAELKKYASLSDIEADALGKRGDMDNTLVAAILKQKLGYSYIPIIKNWLYARCNREILEDSLRYFVEYKHNPSIARLKDVPFATLFVLAEFILRQHSVKAVFTQNYDNFLSLTINLIKERIDDCRYRDLKPLDIYDGWKDEPFTDDCLLIYHVHGYIPSPSELLPNKESNHIVLTQEEFNSMSKDVYSWEHSSQLYYLTHYTCIIWGLSLDDLTSLRLLRHANLEKSSENVYWLRGGEGKTKIKKTAESMKANYFESQNIHVVNDEAGYASLYNRILETIKK